MKKQKVNKGIFVIDSESIGHSTVKINSFKSGKGFTLIELLVVIAIIGLLASVTLVALNQTRIKSRDARRIADMNQFGKAMELYFNTYFSYPTSGAGSIGSKNNVLGQPGVASSTALTPGGFLSKLPIEPTPADGSCPSTGAGSNEYYWMANNSSNLANAYTVTFCIGKATGSLSAGAHTLTQSGFR